LLLPILHALNLLLCGEIEPLQHFLRRVAVGRPCTVVSCGRKQGAARWSSEEKDPPGVAFARVPATQLAGFQCQQQHQQPGGESKAAAGKATI